MKTTKETARRAEELVRQMTTEEKLRVIVETAEAVERLGIPKYYHGNEALHAVVRPGRYTVFPQAIALGAMFDDAFLEEIADAMEEALAIAVSCDTVIFVGGDNTITSGEGRDRCELTLNGRQRELIEKLAALGKPLILVVENGKPLDLSRENEVCDAILMAFFGGETGAKAIVEALTGRFSPAGRLPLSLPRSSTRIPCYYSMLPGGAEDFLEGPKNALFPFGYGLSYTEFAYGGLEIRKIGPFEAVVSCKVKNVGQADGDEVVQLYLDDVESSVVTPPMLLKGFRRIRLKAGEEQTVSFRLDYDSFKLMDIRYRWTVEPGRFRILIGAGSRDIRLEGEITL